MLHPILSDGHGKSERPIESDAEREQMWILLVQLFFGNALLPSHKSITRDGKYASCSKSLL